MFNITKILQDYELLVSTLETIASGFQRQIVNSTLRIENIEVVTHNQVKFTSVLSWQGDAESMSFSFPISVVEERMKELHKS